VSSILARLNAGRRRPHHRPFARGLACPLAALALTLAAGCDGDGEMAITDLEPRTGSLQGEQPVQIKGRNFKSEVGYRIYFGNQVSRSVTIVDENTLLATVPSREDPGPVDVVVLADSGEAFKVHEAYTYADLAGSQQTDESKGNLAY